MTHSSIDRWQVSRTCDRNDLPPRQSPEWKVCGRHRVGHIPPASSLLD